MEAPDTFYVTDPYVRHPVVPVRLSRLKRDQLLGLVAAARQCVRHTDEQKSRQRKLDGDDTSSANLFAR